ncbi:hypothetical protein [Paenibacillus bouchesdurhonensis]|uniref:hypothetical protein n=1 Tax=Paenibacillus bouchesdurhonensis TaxID=1870990 RepID=UPI0019001B90|nr:hypothetical protein [Paenibacillus bouchesdurhonensis]
MERTAQLIFDQLLMQSGSTVSLDVRSRFPGGRNVGGKYSIADHKVTMYVGEIKKQCLSLFGSLEAFPQVLRIVFAHELGHAEDAHLQELSDLLDHCDNEQERKRIALRIEENAWNYAKMLIPEEDQSMMQTVIYYSLKSYREAIAGEIA